MTALPELQALLLTLELELMNPALRRDRLRVAALLAEDFQEVGSSGGIWSREAMLLHLQQESPGEAAAVADFSVRALAPQAVLVTYSTVRRETQILRSSIWVESDDGWKILFHQGTPVPAPGT